MKDEIFYAAKEILGDSLTEEENEGIESLRDLLDYFTPDEILSAYQMYEGGLTYYQAKKAIEIFYNITQKTDREMNI